MIQFCALVVHSKASASQFLPYNSAPARSSCIICVQMDAYSEEEQIGTLFVPRGAVLGGLRGGGLLGPQNLGMVFFTFSFAPPA